MAGAEPVLRLLGLAARAGSVLPGTERVREAARAGGLTLVLVAGDASANSKDKLLPLLVSRGVPHEVVFDRASLGAAVGRAPLSAVGITEPNLAARVREMLRGDTPRADRGRTGR